MNDVASRASIAWPANVINEMSVAIYKSRHPNYKPGDWARLTDDQRSPYIGYTHAALQWIVDQGWVRLPRAGE